MWLVSTFEKNYLRKIFFVSTFLDWYKLKQRVSRIQICLHAFSNHILQISGKITMMDCNVR